MELDMAVRWVARWSRRAVGVETGERGRNYMAGSRIPLVLLAAARESCY